MTGESLSRLRATQDWKDFESMIKEFRDKITEKIIQGEGEGLMEKTKTPLDVIIGQVKILDDLFQEADKLIGRFQSIKDFERHQEATKPVVI